MSICLLCLSVPIANNLITMVLLYHVSFYRSLKVYTILAEGTITFPRQIDPSNLFLNFLLKTKIVYGLGRVVLLLSLEASRCISAIKIVVTLIRYRTNNQTYFLTFMYKVIKNFHRFSG